MRFFTLFFLLCAFTAHAAEVKNLKTGQTGDRGFATFDLAGKPGEKQADVTVFIELGSDRYEAGKLSLTGDFGKGVKVGVGKKIFWDVLKDMPAGFEGQAVWDVEASGTPVGASLAAPASAEQPQGGRTEGSPLQDFILGKYFEKDGFKFYKDVVVDSSTGLMWARNANIAGKAMNWNDAMSWAKNLNYGGYSDWRLPTKEELEVFAKRGGNRPGEYFNSIGFNTVQDSYYWSSSKYYASGTNGFWVLYANVGRAGYANKTVSGYIWPVRSGQF